MVMTLAALVEKSLPAQSLGGCFVSQNNNQSFAEVAGLTTVTITDDDAKVVAFGAAQAVNSKMLYCSVNAVSDDYKNHTISIEEVPNKEEKKVKTFKVVERIPYEVKPDHQNQFETVFAAVNGQNAFDHVFEKLVASTIGLQRMDNDKNVTVDIHGNTEDELRSSVHQWVKTGTIVGDRFTFYSCEVNRYELLGLEADNSDVSLEKVNEENLLDLLDYDAEISIFDREKFTTALVGTPGVFGFVARKNNQVTGYGVGMENKILQCYGDDEETIRQVLATLAAEIMSPEVTFHMREDGGKTMIELADKATKTARIVRLHTRSQPSGIKWSKIACPNLGLSLF